MLSLLSINHSDNACYLQSLGVPAVPKQVWIPIFSSLTLNFRKLMVKMTKTEGESARVASRISFRDVSWLLFSDSSCSGG